MRLNNQTTHGELHNSSRNWELGIVRAGALAHPIVRIEGSLRTGWGGVHLSAHISAQRKLNAQRACVVGTTRT